ncbi:MAG: universal stress protein [Cellulomonas sp.]
MTQMDVLVWINEATWPACVAAARELAPPPARLTLLHVVDDAVPAAARGAFAGLLGRTGRADHEPGTLVRDLADAAGRELLEVAAQAAGRDVTVVQRSGRVEREVVAAAEGMSLLVVARDGDLSRLGPRSLAPATRFVVDHAPCATLLVWPAAAPGVGSIPPPPPHAPHSAHAPH